MRQPPLCAVVFCLLAGPDVVGDVLAPGPPVEFELGVGAVRRHLLTLEAGQFLQVELQEKGPRLTVTLLDPGGATRARRRTLYQTVTRLRLLAIVPDGGTHVLEVRGAPDGASGRYAIRLEPPRHAGERERRLVAADDALAEAITLVNEAAPEPRQLALTRFEAAEQGFRTAGDRLGEAIALHDRGLVQHMDGDLRGTEAAQRSRDLFHALGDAAGEAAAVDLLARTRYRQGDLATAQALFARAVAFAEAGGDRRTLSHYTNDAATAIHRSGDGEKAIESLGRALSLAREIGSARNQGRVLVSLGITYMNVGEMPQALACYERALPLWRAIGHRDGEASTLNNLGLLYMQLGDDDRARGLFEQALPLTRELSQSLDESSGAWTAAAVLNNLARLDQRRGDHARAIELAGRALTLRRKVGHRRGEAQVLKTLGRSRHARGELEAAQQHLTDALRIQREIRDLYAEGDTLHALAAVERDRGNLKEALALVEAAIAGIEGLRSSMNSPSLRASFVASEYPKYDFGLDVTMRLHERDAGAGYDVAALQASERARARVLLEALIEARADIRQGVDPSLLERERALHRELGEAEARLSRALAEDSTGGQAAEARRDHQARAEEYRQLQSRIRQESPRYAELTQPRPATLEEIRRDVLDEETVLLEFSLGEERSFLWAVTRSDLVSDVLPGRAQLEDAARRVHELLAERQRTRAPAALRGADIRLESESRALSRLLLGGIASRLNTDWKGKRLLVVASGALTYLPFGALPTPDAAAEPPLLANHEIVFAPSASLLVPLRRAQVARPPARATVAVLADPVFDASDPRVGRRTVRAKSALARAQGPSPRPVPTAPALTRALQSLGRTRFSRLPFSRLEADAIAASASGVDVVKATGFDANRAAVAEKTLGDAQILHIATHGVFDSEHPELSGLVLSLVDEKGAPTDGFLRMHDIYNLRLPVDLVVLSACQTALGREIRGEGLVGLTRGFMYAGARSVVASLWQVDDESTAELMKRFYRAMLKDGRPPAEALRTAQLEMSRHPRWSAPFYWAGFVLQGEWR